MKYSYCLSNFHFVDSLLMSSIIVSKFGISLRTKSTDVLIIKGWILWWIEVLHFRYFSVDQIISKFDIQIISKCLFIVICLYCCMEFINGSKFMSRICWHSLLASVWIFLFVACVQSLKDSFSLPRFLL